MKLAIPLRSPAVQIIGDNLKINSVTGGSTTSRKREFTANKHRQHLRKETKKPPVTFGALPQKQYSKNNFKVVTTPDATTLEYYQSIYTHCKQKFNIPDGIEVVKKSVYQYIENCINNYLFGNYNISEVRSNLYNNLVHYSQLETENLNSKTLATYFQELNFNIINNKSKQKLKQYSKTTPNTPILPKTTAKHLQTPKQGTSSKLPFTITLFPALFAQAQTPNSLLNQFARLEDFTSPRSPTRQQEPLQTSSNLLDFLAENRSEHFETAANEKNNSKISEEESIDSENKEDKMMAYIAKIPEFNGEDIETSPQEWLDQITKAGNANEWNAARMLGTIPYFLKKTAGEWFENLTTPFNDWTAFKTHAKRYEMAMKEANHTKLMNLAIEETSSASKTISPTNNNSNPKDINHSKDRIKTTSYHLLITSLRIAITVEFLATGKEIAESYNETNKIRVINITLHHSNLIINHHHQLTIHQDLNIKVTIISLPYSQFNSNTNNHPHNIIKINSNNQLVSRNPAQPRPTYYHTQPSYLTILEEQNFYYTALSEARIAKNANLSDIFPFEFEANESPFLLSNAAANEQKTITAMYTKAEVKGKTIHLILDNGSARSIITYQLMQQLKRNVNQPAQTVIITADGMKKTPVGEIDNFPFTLDGITILVKVFIMDVLQVNNLLPKITCLALAFEFKPEEEKPIIETFMVLLPEVFGLFSVMLLMLVCCEFTFSGCG
ncbi:hypothetical protein G9A89_011305 [Geosiphon pyriformis]|nr:hypothetical protein G9A89_011305 [Geosiphon pyriformis]